MSLLSHPLAIIRITFKRLWAQKGLTLAILLGLVAAVALITTVPLYADAVQFRVLQERLDANGEKTQHPPFAYFYQYVGAWHGPIEWEATRPLDDYLAGQGARTLGLPMELFVRHFETDQYRLYPAGATEYSDDDSLTTFYFATTSGIAGQIDIIEGQFPGAAVPAADSTVEVLVTEPLALELGLQVGDAFLAYNFRDSQATTRQIPLRVAGVWQPKEPEAPFWFYKPNVFDDLFLVPEETFAGRLSPYLENEVHLAVWYLVMDGSQVGVNDVNRLAARSNDLARDVATRLPNTGNTITPVDGLRQYRRSVEILTNLLTAFSVPLVTLILAFIGLIVGLSVNQRRNEIAVMRSRGATAGQIIAFALLEGLLLGLLALVLGLAGGLALTQLMGRVRSFLDFSAPTSLRVAVTDTAVRAGLLALGLAVLAQLLPTIAAARDTIITYKQEQSRALKRPWWQRAWLDVLLLIPTLYGLYLLSRQGTLFIVGEESDPLQNPLLLLLPALAAFSFTLLGLRLLPWLMEALSWTLAKSNSVSFLLAARHLARTPGLYATPLILLALTVSLSVFTASLAQTLDLQLYDEMLYRVGADVNLKGAGLFLSRSSPLGTATFGSPAAPAEGQALFLPMSEYLAFPGVTAATRVGRFSGTAQVGDSQEPVTFLGIDRAGFDQVAFWRYDFASLHLGYLLNALAAVPDGVLVSQNFLRDHGLRPGDYLRLTIFHSTTSVEVLTQVAGSLNYFPTWYPGEDDPLLVGNLDALFEQTGGDLPYEVWLRTTADFDAEQFDDALRSRGLWSWPWREPYTRLEQLQLRPERQGVFGLLSVGFAAAALLTVLGFFLYALFSFRRRFIELGILRAVGLTAGKMLLYLAAELSFLILTGLALGTALGRWISLWFIPNLQAGATGSQAPPFLVEIAWSAIAQVYLLFGGMFIAALVALGVLLLRMKIFQAVKLGETT
ncbi:MAG: ABC transporter permease [Chloroflexi bacterium]|nr:ABC transporter permease [Chloroflexota bacterium]MCI0579784.1 ABC transporter permease [Chloroflexota bacterium]MCI0643469.1 ABC transporter permease [Chloroflexota bacterium]MCI0728567.1 ABC transporter permease [Chloroflexota bacterium]